MTVSVARCLAASSRGPGLQAMPHACGTQQSATSNAACVEWSTSRTVAASASTPGRAALSCRQRERASTVVLLHASDHASDPKTFDQRCACGSQSGRCAHPCCSSNYCATDRLSTTEATTCVAVHAACGMICECTCRHGDALAPWGPIVNECGLPSSQLAAMVTRDERSPHCVGGPKTRSAIGVSRGGRAAGAATGASGGAHGGGGGRAWDELAIARRCL